MVDFIYKTNKQWNELKPEIATNEISAHFKIKMY